MSDQTGVGAAPEREAVTTLSLYASDLQWFRRWQMNVSQRQDKWLNMPDSVRVLTRRIDDLEQGEGA